MLIRIDKKPEDFNDGMTGWVAGIIDGEGCVRMAGRTYKGEKYRFLTPTIKINMTCEKTVTTVANYLGCGSTHNMIPKNPKHLQQYCWQASSRQARYVARLILPFAITKREALERMLAHPVQEKFGLKITPEIAREIRFHFFAGESYQEMEKLFGLTKCGIRQVAQRKTWSGTDLDLPTAENLRRGNLTGGLKSSQVPLLSLIPNHK